MKLIRSFGFAFICVLAAQAASAASTGGVPQMDQTWYGNQLLWLAISFLMLYVLVSGSIAPTISKVLSDRDQAISEAIAEAEKAQLAAESTRGNTESTLQTARAKASDFLAAAQAENAANATESANALDHDLHRKADQASARIADAVTKASDQMDGAIVNLASAMTEKLIGVALATPASNVRKKA
jgi:F-type H+-transporting ATPase subunit b